MKYLKYFEKLTEYEESKLKIGDILICNVDRKKYGAKYGKKYIIRDISGYNVSLKTSNGRILKYPKTIEHPNKIKYFYIDNFVTEAGWELKKYNI